MMRRNAVAEEGEDEEEFYESLDRILSSSGSSTSGSASDDDHGDDGSSPLLSHDVWTSEPAPVAERRRLLFQRYGLAGDSILSRLPRPGDAPAPALDAPFSSDARSDASLEPSSVRTAEPLVRPHRHRHRQRSANLSVSISRSSSSGVIEVSDGDGGRGNRRPEDCGAADCDDPRCLIRNLDNGREFVVKEFGEDGMGKKFREVGTGRQLTMQEFEMCVGCSPIVQELMRQQNVEDAEAGRRSSVGSGESGSGPRTDGVLKGGTRSKKKGGWLRSIRTVAGAAITGGHHHYHQDRRSSDDKDTSSEKGGRRSSSATDDSQDGAQGLDLRVKVSQYGKSHKEFTGLYMSQAIQAHNGSIWSIKFSLDGRYLASAGEDCVIHIWEVSDISTKSDLLKAAEENENFKPFAMAISNSPSDPRSVLACAEANSWDKKRRAKIPNGRKSNSSDSVIMPEHVFALSDNPFCSFRGHVDDVLDLSWWKSQYLLSSSMDKTVRLWDLPSKSCLKIFTHSDYVTCIQFNPIDHRYFISGSLDEKVRIWSIPDRQIVDWDDLHEMVTAACYTPDGQGALVGSHKGSCHLYDTSDNKLLQKSQIDLQNKRKRSRHKKITGFQFAPGSNSRILITSADSRVRVVDGNDLIHKFRGFRNRSSQISAYWTAGGKYVICASEDSQVYVWRYDEDSQPNRTRTTATVTQSYEHFHCQGVTMAIPWPSSGMGGMARAPSNKQNSLSGESQANSPLKGETDGAHLSPSPQSQNTSRLSPRSNHFCDRGSATWPEELVAYKQSLRDNGDPFSSGYMPVQSSSTWGLAIITASRCDVELLAGLAATTSTSQVEAVVPIQLDGYAVRLVISMHGLFAREPIPHARWMLVLQECCSNVH
ncbi:WD repeat-containing protein 44-like isoform X1 [Zingiber officinale]|uniref:WD repeat-containing protein 44-like isoform X1 n=1 Tax=Zingiber officinale TaxID=94328 RepID=UPI001C4B069D|nr:WD repeat-containing protein 44-like isoform X1 [Zingiber officinale]